MNADCGNIEFAPGGAFVQGLDILEDVLEKQTVSDDQPLSEAVKHERVVRIGRVAEGQGLGGHVGLDTVKSPVKTRNIDTGAGRKKGAGISSAP
jgi:hypothetical protein